MPELLPFLSIKNLPLKAPTKEEIAQKKAEAERQRLEKEAKKAKADQAKAAKEEKMNNVLDSLQLAMAQASMVTGY